jgi:hypothetical protein
MNRGVIERIEYRTGGGRYGSRAYIRLWVSDRDGRRLCWVDVEATNYVLKKRQRVCWRGGRVYCEQSPAKPLVNLEQLGYGKPEEL